jgi:hypothetical protein
MITASRKICAKVHLSKQTGPARLVKSKGGNTIAVPDTHDRYREEVSSCNFIMAVKAKQDKKKERNPTKVEA